MKHNRVIALGFFDGVHRGHAALLAAARQQADRLGVSAAVLTFSNHPDELVFGRPTPLLNTLEDRRWLLKQHGMDEVLEIPFDRALMQTPWEVFVEELLVNRLDAVHVVCGHDFTFGHRGAGNPQRLQEKCAALGVGCDVIAPVLSHGMVISSTQIRTLIREGRVEEANELLGHLHFLTAAVQHGKALGRRLGIPTANLPVPKGVLQPAFGVYAGRVILADGSVHPAVANVGTRPTVSDDLGVVAEAWLLDFSGSLYGQSIRLELCRYLRPEKKFDSLEALQAEVQKNAQQTRDYFAGLQIN